MKRTGELKVGDPTATISPDRRYIYLSVPIEEGERYAVGEVKFSGMVLPTAKIVQYGVDLKRVL